MSPRTKQQLESLKEVRREQLMLAALQLFSDKGYHNTSISDIAVKAKISKGLLYNYFESKETLLNEVVIMAFRDVAQETGKLLENIKSKPAKEVFAIMVESFFTMLKEQKELWKLTLSLAVQVSSIPSVHKTIMLVYGNILQQMETLFEMLGSKDPKKEALLLGALTDGISIQYMIFGDEYPLDELKNMIIKKYTNEN